jgi:Protein NO VEIN, C-terminal
MPRDWSRTEVEALVADYFAMLDAELRGEDYSKTAHRRALSPLLSSRSDGSIERKHQNVSAILIELGYPYISGYKPLSNYQGLLFDVVSDRLATNAALAATVRAAVEAPAAVPTVEDILNRWEQPPEPATPVSYGVVREGPPRVRPPVNYLEREAHNASLGQAGEEFTLHFERARLIRAGRHALADRVEHVAVTMGDGAGFDVLSFERSGQDRLIEVKTTAYGKQTPFFLSRNEVRISRDRRANYHLYRLFRFREDPRLYGLQGALDETCVLDPVQFSAQVK